jgi:Na+-transporting NADH:ubiquinone oxidoreductase subunit C
MSGKDSVSNTILVALGVCIFCSVFVSFSSVSLRDRQRKNAELDLKKNLLLSSGVLKNKSATKEQILEAFKKIETKIVDLATGEYVEGLDVESFNQLSEAKDPKTSILIEASEDLAKIKRRSKRAKVYLVKEDGRTSKIILPVYGLGLWSILYGFLALDVDTVTVKGFGFYQHGETPGLGGEVDAPYWKAKWIGKKVYDDNFIPVIEVVKGQVNPNSSSVDSQIDGLAGATITSNGVTNLLHYWLGNNGFGPYLEAFRSNGGKL